MKKSAKRKTISKKKRYLIHAKCRSHCAYCGVHLPLSTMHVDHLIPMEYHSMYMAIGIDIDSMDNYMPACYGCNSYKSNLTLEKFREAVERWSEVLMRDSVTYRNAVRFGLVEPKPRKVVFYFEQLQREEG